MSSTILVIDDDPALTQLLEINLTKAGYRFVSAAHGIAGLQSLERERPTLVLLDINMPKLDGWETCRLIREVSTVPILMLTARDDEADIARGLDLGADDYITKPFGIVELLARVRAALRRVETLGSAGGAGSGETYQMGSLLVDLSAHTVTRNNTVISLTPTEFRLLEHLLRHTGQALTHQQLLSAVWGSAYSDATELLKPTMSRLRQKVEEDPARPMLIQTVYGIGYRLVAPSSQVAPRAPDDASASSDD